MRKSKILILLWGSMLFQCSDPVEIKSPKNSQKLVPQEQIDDLIITALEKTGGFNWNTTSDHVLWSALMHSDSILTIGYKPDLETQINSRMASLQLQDSEWEEARNAIITEVTRLTLQKKTTDVRLPNLQAYVHDVLPYLEIKVFDLETVTRLRQMHSVRYVEPLSYRVSFNRPNKNRNDGRISSNSGCDNSADPNIPGSDYQTISPNAKAPWNYNYMSIQQAWDYSTGQGITVGLIDTGLSPDQSKLHNEFNSGESSGRSIEKYGTFVSSWWPWANPDGPNDDCGHGTAMAGTIAAPRNQSGASVGVAYNCNLISYRGTDDVILNGGSEKTGVSNALVALGNRTDVKIISMSLGDIFSSSKIADAIRYAYGKGKLIFCAAGTSTELTNWVGVIFPAWMNETVAVTGIKEGNGYQRCDVCHSGYEVDFTIVMERAVTSTKPLTLAMSGNQPSRVGGSSVATATAAGIAALIWARNPQWSRNQVLQKMKESSSIYPSRSSEYGWGTPNAKAAVM